MSSRNVPAFFRHVISLGALAASVAGFAYASGPAANGLVVSGIVPKDARTVFVSVDLEAGRGSLCACR